MNFLNNVFQIKLQYVLALSFTFTINFAAAEFNAVSILSPQSNGACHCVLPEHCADGGGAIKPRQDNLTKGGGGGECSEGYRYCCVIVKPIPTTTTLPPPPPCGLQRTSDVPGFNHDHSDLASFGEYPWMIRILNKWGKFLGSGALIGDSTVLTVAHIFENSDPATVVIGEWNDAINVLPFDRLKIPVKSFKIHYHYNSVNLHHDIALIQLQSPVDLWTENPQIGTVCLSSKSFENHRCFLSTFGNEKLPVMRKIDLPILSGLECQDILRTTTLGKSFLLDRFSFLCASELGKGVCKGHGGSPLVCKVQGHFQLAGLVSWGLTDDDCKGKGHFPGIYVNVHSYRNWIENTIANGFD